MIKFDLTNKSMINYQTEYSCKYIIDGLVVREKTVFDYKDFIYDDEKRLIKELINNELIKSYQYIENSKKTLYASGYWFTEHYDKEGRIINRIDAVGRFFIKEYGDDNKVMYYEDETGVKIKDGKPIYSTPKYNIWVKPI